MYNMLLSAAVNAGKYVLEITKSEVENNNY